MLHHHRLLIGPTESPALVSLSTVYRFGAKTGLGWGGGCGRGWRVVGGGGGGGLVVVMVVAGLYTRGRVAVTQKQTDSQTERQKDRHTQTHTHTHTLKHAHSL